MDAKRYDVIAKGPTVVSSHEKPAEAAEAAKAAALAGDTLVEVYDHDLKRTIFRARGGEWRWVTR